MIQVQVFSNLALKLTESQVSHESAEALQVRHLISHKAQADADASKYPVIQVQVFSNLALKLTESQVSHESAEALQVRHLISHKAQADADATYASKNPVIQVH